jgi:hypothetical protein
LAAEPRTGLEKQLASMRHDLENQRAAAAAKRQKHDAQLAESALTTALLELGVDRNRLRGAIGIHMPSVAVSDAGVVRYRMDRGGYDEGLEPAAVLKEWADTDEGRAFIAPPTSRPNAPGRLRAAVVDALGGAMSMVSARQQLAEGVLAELGEGASITIR